MDTSQMTKEEKIAILYDWILQMDEPSLDELIKEYINE